MPVSNFCMPTIIWNYVDQQQASTPQPIQPPQQQHYQQPQLQHQQQQQHQFINQQQLQQQQQQQYQQQQLQQQQQMQFQFQQPRYPQQQKVSEASRKRLRTFSLEQETPMHKYRKQSNDDDSDWVVIIKK